MAIVGFDPVAFRAQFTAYANPIIYPDVTLDATFDTATAYITDQNGGCYGGFMTLKQQTVALNLMTAHLLELNSMAAKGETAGVLTGATIDKVSVQVKPPPGDNQWQYWLNQTPYGTQLLALLQVAGVGGQYFSRGLPVVGAFRRW